MWSDLAELRGPARTLSMLVQKGMRAVSVSAKTSSFDGLLRPGDRVDVLFTPGQNGVESGPTGLLLQNLLVLSVGSDVGRADEAPKDRLSRGNSVTLSTTVEQAQLVTQAKERGRLTLTLRNSSDITLVEAAPATGKALAAPAPAPAQGEPLTARVKVQTHVR